MASVSRELRRDMKAESKESSDALVVRLIFVSELSISTACSCKNKPKILD